MRRTLAVLLALALLGAGCGDDQPVRETSGPDAAVLDDVEVTGEDDEQPTLTFEEPFEVEESVARVITEGDGDPIAVNSVVTLNYVFVNGRDGEVVDTSYGKEPVDLVFEDSLAPGLFAGLEGVTAGSRVLIALAPSEGLGANTSTGVEETDTLLFLVDVLEVHEPLQRAEGEAVPPVDGLPTVELADDGAPTITVPSGEPPVELIAQPLVKGDGAVVEVGQSITVHYTGVIWDTGAVFDSSWEGDSPATFDIGTGAVIPGWDEGLVGRTVGSQILLVVPPAKGYPEGSPDGVISATDTLVFVVDILDAG